MRRQTRARGRRGARQSRFAVNMVPRVPRSTFNRSHSHKATMDTGVLIPVKVDEILPGDTVRMQMASFARLATPLHPLLDDLQIDFHVWFVQNRNIWTQFLAFMGEQDDINNPTDYLTPVMSPPAGGWAVGSLGDHMGIRPGVDGFTHSALPFRGYQKIFDDYYRPQELRPIDPNVDYSSDGPDVPANYQIQPRYRRHDYFSSALISPQRGPGVDLPIGGQAPLVGQPGAHAFVPPTIEGMSSGTVGSYKANAVNTPNGYWNGNGFILDEDLKWNHPGIDLGTTPAGMTLPYADLDNTVASGLTVNAWREAVTLQRFLEAEARGGSRYAELVNTMFGVTFPDRLYRAEYLGGTSTNITVSQVPQTSETTAQSPQGNLAAFGQGGGVGRPIMKSFDEHGWLIVLASARRTVVSYQQGLHKMWSRRTRYDHYFPMFANLGEQPILNKELYVAGDAQDDETFGYAERWSEYKFAFNTIAGEFRSDFAQSLDTWHLADDYLSRPALNEQWMVEKPPMDRVLAITDTPQLLLDMYFSVAHTRCMPTYGVPGLTRF